MALSAMLVEKPGWFGFSLRRVIIRFAHELISTTRRSNRDGEERRERLRPRRSDDEDRAWLARMRASSPKWLARASGRTLSALAPPYREGNAVVMLRCRRSENARRQRAATDISRDNERAQPAQPPQESPFDSHPRKRDYASRSRTPLGCAYLQPTPTTPVPIAQTKSFAIRSDIFPTNVLRRKFRRNPGYPNLFCHAPASRRESTAWKSSTQIARFVIVNNFSPEGKSRTTNMIPKNSICTLKK